jgi:large subunit ribosomal protein L37Ae
MPKGYGKRVRQLFDEAKVKSSKTYKCPSCSRIAIRRKASGVWECRKCGKKYASGAFEFKIGS